MIAKRFFHICAGILCLALAYHLGARSATAQLGNNQEVATLTGVVSDGGTIPLPHYQDGTEAPESDCHWTVSPQILDNTGTGGNPAFQRCSLDGRIVRAYWCNSQCGTPGDCASNGCGAFPWRPGTANYLIIAVRNTTPTPAAQQTWGGVKARYRPEGTAKQPQDR